MSDLKLHTLTWFLTALLAISLQLSDAKEYVFIKGITIEGNTKTKTTLILREIDFQKGDSLKVADLTTRLERNEQLLMNTGLFNEVKINIDNWNEDIGAIDLTLDVTESWYFFPLPIFQLADRNFNVWWKENNHSFSRVNYGVRLSNYNFSGNKDILKLTLQAGYKRKVLLQYERPYINRKKTIGITGKVFMDHRREFPYTTRFNKRVFYEDSKQINFRSFKSIFSLHFRPRFELSHELFVKFEHNRVTDEILELNYDYFKGSDRLRFFEVTYIIRRERRDNRFYGLKGDYSLLEISKSGLGVFKNLNKFTTRAQHLFYTPITSWLNLETFVSGQIEWTGNQHPQFGLEALGFGQDFVRGYELYVIDGTNFFVNRNSLRFKILDRSFNLKKKMPLRTYRNLPIMLWLSINGDLGYAKNDLYSIDNPLDSRLLKGGGIGLDIILYHKFVFQVEFSMNHLNEKGLFLRSKSDF